MLLLVGHFILTVTRSIPESDTQKISPKRVHAKRKSADPEKLISLYKFKDFNDFSELCSYLPRTDFKKAIDNSCLYRYLGIYYLSLKTTALTLKDFKSLHGVISEFATYVLHPDLIERKLNEHGEIIINKNAIDTCNKYFA